MSKIKACPYGHQFGDDHDRHDACDECPEVCYNACCAEYLDIKLWEDCQPDPRDVEVDNG